MFWPARSPRIVGVQKAKLTEVSESHEAHAGPDWLETRTESPDELKQGFETDFNLASSPLNLSGLSWSLQIDRVRRRRDFVEPVGSSTQVPQARQVRSVTSSMFELPHQFLQLRRNPGELCARGLGVGGPGRRA